MLKLSEATQHKLAQLDAKALHTGQLIEMRNKYGLLLGVGTTISAFQELTDKKGNFLYSFEVKEGWNDKLEYFKYTTSDAVFDIYSKRDIKSPNPNFQIILKKTEDYWYNRKLDWDKSDSVLKECPGVIINKIK